MKNLTKILAVSACTASLAFASVSFAFGSEDSGSTSSDPTFSELMTEAEQALDSGKYVTASRSLREAVRLDSSNADAWNLLGFASRQSGNTDRAWDAYDRALSLDPSHIGALNYLGHLFLQTGDKASAQENLAKIAAICTSCEEYTDLAAAINAS